MNNKSETSIYFRTSQPPVHIISAWASENEIALGQLRVYEKSNEITAIPALLASIFLKNCLVSIDAMGC